MKKFHFIALVVCTGFLWACHKDGPTENPFADAPWAIDETLPVPIQFGSPAASHIETKADAIIESLDGLRLKIVAFDQNQNLLLGKELCAVGNGSGVGSSGTIAFKNDSYTADATYYYPFHNPNSATRSNFSFLAYHISQDIDAQDVTSGFNNGIYWVSFPFDPAGANEDVLIAGAQAQDYTLTEDIYKTPGVPASGVLYANGTTYHGFNALYQRVTRRVSEQTMIDHYPVLNFSHATARIVIKAKAASATAETSFTGSGLKVKLNTITQVNAREKVRVNLTGAINIVDYTQPELGIVWDPNSDALQDPITMDNTVAPALKPTVAGVALCTDESLFLVPGTDNVLITYTITNNTSSSGPIQATLEAPDGGFLPGRTYTYNIVVDEDMQVVISTNLAGWIPSAGGGDINQD